MLSIIDVPPPCQKAGYYVLRRLPNGNKRSVGGPYQTRGEAESRVAYLDSRPDKWVRVEAAFCPICKSTYFYHEVGGLWPSSVTCNEASKRMAEDGWDDMADKKCDGVLIIVAKCQVLRHCPKDAETGLA